MLWIKAFHIVFMVSWFAGLFYLPRLYVYHAMSDDIISQERFLIMERKLLNGIMLPAMVLTLASGIWMLYDYAWTAYQSMLWLHTKLLLVAVLLLYHYFCRRYYLNFLQGRNTKSHIFFRWFNELPVIILMSICILVIVKPF